MHKPLTGTPTIPDYFLKSPLAQFRWLTIIGSGEKRLQQAFSKVSYQNHSATSSEIEWEDVPTHMVPPP